MQASDPVYLIASFDSAQVMQQAIPRLGVPTNRIVILGRGHDIEEMAHTNGFATSLDSAIPLDEAIRVRLEWYQEETNNHLLAVQTTAGQGHDMRMRLIELGGAMIDAPNVGEQISDVDIDPGMITPEPSLPHHDQLAFNPREG